MSHSLLQFPPQWNSLCIPVLKYLVLRPKSKIYRLVSGWQVVTSQENIGISEPLPTTKLISFFPNFPILGFLLYLCIVSSSYIICHLNSLPTSLISAIYHTFYHYYYNKYFHLY